MTTNTSYDLIIIGGGAAGFAAAIKADEMGAKVLMANSELPIGGTCVNVGCVPTKFLLEVASNYWNANHPRFKSIKSSAKIDFRKVMEEKDELINNLRKVNYRDVLENLPNVTYLEGKAKFISRNEIEVNGNTYSAGKFLISTGSSTRVLPIKGLEEVGFLTNRSALKLKELPESLLVIGGGPMGLEFAQIFSRLGSKVTVVELMDRILFNAEPVISEELKKCLEEEGINILTGAKTEEVKRTNGKKLALIEKDNRTIELGVDEILLAAGVVGNSKGMGLEKAGVEAGKGGFVNVNEYLETNIPHIYAAGDVIGPPWLETVAAKEGNIAARNALNEEKVKMDFENIPYAVFTSPQVASVGMKESEYMEKYGTCMCSTLRMDQIPKAMAIKDTKGLIHMVLDHKTKQIKGVHILSSLASEIIHEATLAVKFGLTIDEVIDTVHIFPTFSEAVKIVSQSFSQDLKRMSCCVV